MTDQKKYSRRDMLKMSANVMGMAGMMAVLPGLGLRAAAAGEEITVGFIYTGPRDDFGWNQAHAVAARRIAELPGVRLIEQENVPETNAVANVMESMIRLDGAKVLFPTSFGYWPFIQRLAPRFDDVLFVHAGGLWKDGDAPNTIGYRGFMEEGHYCAGIAAGRMTETNRIAFIGSLPLYFIFNNCNGFTLGARSVNPDVTCRVIITGDWNDPVREAEAVNSLVDQGVDVIVANTDSPQVCIETAERRGIYSCGYHTDQSSLAPNGFLTGAEWNWARGADFVEAWRGDGDYPNLYRGGFARDMVSLSPFGANVPEDVREEVLAARQGFVDDTLPLYAGPLRDNEGNTILEEGEVVSNTDHEFKVGVDWLVEGAIGRTGLGDS
ncbi:simple sugar transport system substrate-binding protein [Natronocella acetinitrilica]|uniref:Simple sugar transport system substrate-binding protein n=1 Tax=Natronocella acetinitrilica TaxID=414046 RepID=A0AAE3G0T7_9GAMM|nr:BMP family ABC transporter substrate-binding protein [Natronocella acetinitrilica]MCP1673516.1 simple sugar transport system substrate-binding protein [Natronocella acetinitrilica]